MKIIIIFILLISLVLVGGCDNDNNDCRVGLFPSSADYAYCNKQRWDTLLNCARRSGYRFDGKNCIPMEKQTGCITFKGLEKWQVPNLPIGYENLTDHYEDEYLEIRIFCTGWLLKPYNITCEEWEENTETPKSEVSYYEISGMYTLNRQNKTIELCWD